MSKIKDFFKKLYEVVTWQLAYHYYRHVLRVNLKRFGFPRSQIKEIMSVSLTKKEIMTAYEQARVQALGC